MTPLQQWQRRRLSGVVFDDWPRALAGMQWSIATIDEAQTLTMESMREAIDAIRLIGGRPRYNIGHVADAFSYGYNSLWWANDHVEVADRWRFVHCPECNDVVAPHHDDDTKIAPAIAWICRGRCGGMFDYRALLAPKE